MVITEEFLVKISGLYVGMLSQEELNLFEEAIHLGRAKRIYEGAPGFLGLAKVCIICSHGYSNWDDCPECCH